MKTRIFLFSIVMLILINFGCSKSHNSQTPTISSIQGKWKLISYTSLDASNNIRDTMYGDGEYIQFNNDGTYSIAATHIDPIVWYNRAGTYTQQDNQIFIEWMYFDQLNNVPIDAKDTATIKTISNTHLIINSYNRSSTTNLINQTYTLTYEKM